MMDKVGKTLCSAHIFFPFLDNTINLAVSNAVFKVWFSFMGIRSFRLRVVSHNALNRRAGGQCRLQFYLLIELLHREARLTSITIKLVSDKKLKRIQRRKYRQLQQKLFDDAWEQYQTGNKSASQLLRCCSHLNGPARCQ